MKKLIINTAAVAALGCGAAAVQAQDLYAGLGLPNIYTLGYAHPVSQSWGLRGEYAGGTSASTNGTDNGVSYDATFKSSRAGVFADWFAFGGGFRFVGGVTANDTKLDLNARGTGNATINGNTVSMVGNYFNVRLKYPTATPYLGVGYGHHKADKGLGFYFDAGVTFGSFTAEVETNLVGKTGSNGAITQADVDAQKQKMNDSLAGYKVMPSVSVGMVYRF